MLSHNQLAPRFFRALFGACFTVKWHTPMFWRTAGNSKSGFMGDLAGLGRGGLCLDWLAFALYSQAGAGCPENQLTALTLYEFVERTNSSCLGEILELPLTIKRTIMIYDILSVIAVRVVELRLLTHEYMGCMGSSLNLNPVRETRKTN